MKHLIVLVGPPGAGKTTKAKEYESLGYWRISQDDMGKSEHQKIFNETLKTGDNIVIDRMGFSKSQRDRYINPAKEHGYLTTIVVIHESMETCFARCAARVGHPTVVTQEDASRAINFFFSKYERPADNEADNVVRLWPEGEKPPCVVVDLDGTLCNVDHRLHHMRGEKKNWKAFFAEMINDSLNDWCSSIMLGMELIGYKIILCSGRPDNFRGPTVSWLGRNDIHYDGLFMRNRSDSRKDDIAKENILDFEILTRYTPIVFIDDRQQVVDKYRSRGFTVLQCAKGDF